MYEGEPPTDQAVSPDSQRRPIMEANRECAGFGSAFVKILLSPSKLPGFGRAVALGMESGVKYSL
jgi:hypothetical protein